MPYRSDLPVPLNEYDHLWRLALDKGPSQPAGLPVPNSTRSFWLHPSSEVNPLAKEGSQGSLSGDADICIIGSGITGISAAYHFAKAVANSDNAKSLKVVVLEARDFCSGATGENHVSVFEHCHDDCDLAKEEMAAISHPPRFSNSVFIKETWAPTRP